MPTLERNLKLYSCFRMAADSFAWIPVFFLYLSQTLPLSQVIQLSAVYYLSVFVLEVPSGYFSDRIGRRATLLLSAASLVLSYCCFLVGAGFWWFAAAQFFLAAGIAMESGTDTAFHFDSLKALGRESEYAAREARAEHWGHNAMALACFAGGALALIDLRLAYVYSLAGALVMGVLAWLFVEPRHADETSLQTGSFGVTLWGCLARLRDPLLGWLFVFMVVLYALAHVVYEFYQPYITLLDLSLLDAGEQAPLISGIIIGISMFGGGIAARVSVRWQARLGLVGIMALAMFMQMGIVGAMAAVVSPLVLALVFARNFPMALVIAPARAAIAPRIGREQRATYLSLQGLAERLFFALLLLGLASGLEPGAPIEEPTLLGILGTTLWIGVVCTLILSVFVSRVRELAAGAENF